MSRRSAVVVANRVITVVALLLFARLTQRHVGDSYFLADQVDQLQKYEAALSLEPEGLWGPAMSGTAARALGPVGALTFGLPVSLGLGVDAIHALTSLLLAVGVGLALWQLARINPVLAWTWFILFTAMRMVWWSAAMFWVNTLLLPFGLFVLALFAAHLRQPSWTKVGSIALMLMLALQVHLAALVGLPILLIGLYAAWMPQAQRASSKSRFERRSRIGHVLIAVALVVAVLPYAFAEARTNFRNTRAMFSHVDTAMHSRHDEGRRAALETLQLSTDPLALAPDRTAVALATGSAIAAVALALLVLLRKTSATDGHAEISQMLWLVAAALIGVVGQALFFAVMARPLNGLHYAILLAPWYALPSAALVAGLFSTSGQLPTRASGTVLGVIAIGLLVFRAPSLADRFAERTPWSYRTIVAALNALCAGQSVQTLEGPGLVNELTPSSDSVLQYLLKRGHSRCHYDPNADVLIAANRTGSFDATLEFGGARFTRDTVIPPGLARYRRGEP